MKLILILSFLLSLSVSAGEVKIVLDKPSALTGEVISGNVSNYQGPVVSETLLDESVYILHLDQERIEMVFVKPLTTNTIKLNDVDYLIWNPVEIVKVDESANIQLFDQSFELKSYLGWVYLIGFLICVIIFLWVYFVRLRHAWAKKKARKHLKTQLFMASQDIHGITQVWKGKNIFLEAFPFIEEEFNKFEVTFYLHAFKPKVTEEEKNEMLKAYDQMLDRIRGGDFGV